MYFYKKLFIGLTIVIITTIFVGCFYWFSWQPRNIRKECAKKAGETTATAIKIPGASSNDVSIATNLIYQNCIRSHGIGQ